MPSPTFFRTAIDIADELRELQIDETWVHEIVRRKILHDQAVFTRRSFTEPEAVKKELLSAVRGYLGADYESFNGSWNHRPSADPGGCRSHGQAASTIVVRRRVLPCTR